MLRVTSRRPKWWSPVLGENFALKPVRTATALRTFVVKVATVWSVWGPLPPRSGKVAMKFWISMLSSSAISCVAPEVVWIRLANSAGITCSCGVVSGMGAKFRLTMLPRPPAVICEQAHSREHPSKQETHLASGATWNRKPGDRGAVARPCCPARARPAAARSHYYARVRTRHAACRYDFYSPFAGNGPLHRPSRMRALTS